MISRSSFQHFFGMKTGRVPIIRHGARMKPPTTIPLVGAKRSNKCVWRPACDDSNANERRNAEERAPLLPPPLHPLLRTLVGSMFNRSLLNSSPLTCDLARVSSPMRDEKIFLPAEDRQLLVIHRTIHTTSKWRLR